MVAPLLAAIAPKLLGGIFSIFGANKARRQAKQDAANKFVDLRDAAIKGGFNPLTALETTGGAGFGGYGSSAPPLASVELLTGALESGMDEVTGAAAQRRASDRLALEMGQLKLDQARSGVLAYAPPSAGRGIGSGPSMGRQAVTVATPVSRGGLSFGVTAPDRKIDVRDVPSEYGVSVLQNEHTNGPIFFPTLNDETIDLGTLPVVLTVGAPQYLRNSLDVYSAEAFKRQGKAGDFSGSPLLDVNVTPSIPRSGHGVDLRSWPYDGVNPFNPKYRY